MNADAFYRVGREGIRKAEFSDNDVEEQVHVLGCVVGYLEGREDAELVLPTLKKELNDWRDERTKRYYENKEENVTQ